MSDRPAAEADPGAAFERERELSQARIEAGGIPLAAERRLRELGEGAGAFTSDLSVGSFALCDELELTPLGQVMGSSVYQVAGYLLPTVYAGGFMYELDGLSASWNEARDRAFARLAIEAAHLGADAVVGVQIKRGQQVLTEGAIDYTVVGTAVRRGPRRRAKHERAEGPPVMTELSMPDFAKLHRAGIQTLGVVAWTSLFYVQSWTAAALGGFTGLMANQELPEYTGGVYEAREGVMARVTSQAARIGASGVVGMRLDHTVRPGNERGLIMGFDAIGTAIRQAGSAELAPPETIVNLD
jgi:uncharacterized protein YbjQ (UPF0145 family)